MGTRFRLLLVTLGALAVAAVYTFPRWVEFVLPETTLEEVEELLPGLDPALEAEFIQLPPDQQAVYLSIGDPVTAAAMVNAALSPSVVVPENEQALPEMAGAVVVAEGAFTQLDAVRWADGDVTVFEDADGSKYVRFEDFTMVNGPDLRVVLSTTANPASIADARLDLSDIDLGELHGTLGSQNYEIPATIELDDYASVIIYSRELDILYSYASI